MPHTIRREAADTLLAPSRVQCRWAALIAVAVLGSAIFGGSLSLVLPGWAMTRAALWLALSAGLALCLFIPTLRFATGATWVACCDAALVTMAFGEVVLLSGALVNVFLWQLTLTAHAGLINALTVALSNGVMLAGLALQLRLARVNLARVIGCWFLVLNGSGALFFLGFYRLLHGA